MLYIGFPCRLNVSFFLLSKCVFWLFLFLLKFMLCRCSGRLMVLLRFIFDLKCICDSYVISIYLVNNHSIVFFIWFAFIILDHLLLYFFKILYDLERTFSKNDFIIIITQHHVSSSNSKCASDNLNASLLLQKGSHALGTFPPTHTGTIKVRQKSCNHPCFLRRAPPLTLHTQREINQYAFPPPPMLWSHAKPQDLKP